ncbi:uncharacterized protein LOC143026207 [Oratosquilla oratoria]|uniref:uncharacterized protein LOC143026207 n=1 Tax=Oratosquilla oratoria TaxID=337810 RepID=UPI003F776ECE
MAPGTDSLMVCPMKLPVVEQSLRARRTVLDRVDVALASISTELLGADLVVYVDHLKRLHNDMETRFSDLLQMTVPDWFVDPFIDDASEVDVTLKESVIEL